MTRLVALLFTAAVLLSCMAQTVQGQSPLPPWVSIVPAEDCSHGCWVLDLERSEYENENESGGNHNIYGRMTVNGESPDGLPWHVAYPDGNIRILTKQAPEWSDFPIFACFNPDNQTGAYWAYAGDTEAQSDVVRGMGLPQCLHVNYRLVWKWQPTHSHRLFLPTLHRSP